MTEKFIELLVRNGIRPSAQRVAIAAYVLNTSSHPSADGVWRRVKAGFPMVSRATVYNTLRLFVEKGLLRELVLAPDSSVYDPNTEPHHHFVDEVDGSIEDVPWGALTVATVGDLPDYDVRELGVVLRGRRRAAGPQRPEPGSHQKRGKP